jgi:hypothetical protein
LLLNCAASGDAPPSAHASAPDLPGAVLRTANPDPTGASGQPDYDSEARSLRGRIAARIGEDPPPGGEAACRAMFDAADRYYAERVVTPEERRRVLDRLAATRDEDLMACLQETSPAGAICAKILMEDGTHELAWALDQCSRAFPRR